MAILNFHLVVSGDLAAAQQATRTALEAAGFTVTKGRDHWKATHGSVATTMFLGLRANDADVREVLDVRFTDLDGTVRVDLHRPIFQPAGGSDDGLEQRKLHTAYQDVVSRVQADLQRQGVLVSADV